MYRQGLGDCFLLTFPAERGKPVSHADRLRRPRRHAETMKRDRAARARHGPRRQDRARLASMSSSARTSTRTISRDSIRRASSSTTTSTFGAVWLGWTENLTKPEIKKIKEAKKKVARSCGPRSAARWRRPPARRSTASTRCSRFSEDDDTTGAGTIADALEYLKLRGKDAGDLQYLEPGAGPFELDGLDGVRVYVLGPPRDPILLKGSEVTEATRRRRDLSPVADGRRGRGRAGAGVPAAAGTRGRRDHPFSAEHRIARQSIRRTHGRREPYFAGIQSFVAEPTTTHRRPGDESTTIG